MKRILAVDDNLIDNMINKILLRKMFPEYELIIFSDPAGALHFIKQNRGNLPNLILLDINMPMVSGWDLVNELVDQQFQGSVFMLTSSIFRGDEERARKVAFIKDYFIKPLKIEMIDRMRECLSADAAAVLPANLIPIKRI